MELFRDLIRDLVVILFPGGLVVIFLLWLLFGIIVIILPSFSLDFLSTINNFSIFYILLIFSYIAGQLLRIRQLTDLEKKCTKEYRNKRIENFKKNRIVPSEEGFIESIRKLDELEQKYYEGNLNIEKLKTAFDQHHEMYSIWEEFPYPYFNKCKRFFLQTLNFNKFFEKYEKQGITKDRTFFNFCKAMVYEYSPSLKEELIRQESLVRLFAGIYYASKFCIVVNLIVGILHTILILFL